jgi:hypothetical protein
MGREIDYGGAVMRHGSPRLGRVGGRFRNRLSEGNHDTAEASIRNSRIVGNTEVILWTDRFVAAGITPDQSDFWKMPRTGDRDGATLPAVARLSQRLLVAYTPAN